MAKKTLLITTLIIFLVGGIAIAGIYVRKNYLSQKEEGFNEIPTKTLTSKQAVEKQASPEKSTLITASPNAKSKNILIDSPNFNEEVHSPLIILGKARGFWFFEGEFPVTLKDADGKVIARASAIAEGNWMTTDFVLFKVQLKFPPPSTKTGILVFEKSRQKEGEVGERFEISIRFTTP